MTPLWDSVEPLEPIAPGQISEPDSYPIEPRCECGRLLVHTRAGEWICTRHGENITPEPLEPDA